MNIRKLGHDVATLVKDTLSYPATVAQYRFLAENGVLNPSARRGGKSEGDLRRLWFEEQRDRERRALKQDLKQLGVDITA